MTPGDAGRRGPGSSDGDDLPALTGAGASGDSAFPADGPDSPDTPQSTDMPAADADAAAHATPVDDDAPGGFASGGDAPVEGASAETEAETGAEAASLASAPPADGARVFRSARGTDPAGSSSFHIPSADEIAAGEAAVPAAPSPVLHRPPAEDSSPELVADIAPLIRSGSLARPASRPPAVAVAAPVPVSASAPAPVVVEVAPAPTVIEVAPAPTVVEAPPSRPASPPPSPSRVRETPSRSVPVVAVQPTATRTGRPAAPSPSAPAPARAAPPASANPPPPAARASTGSARGSASVGTVPVGTPSGRNPTGPAAAKSAPTRTVAAPASPAQSPSAPAPAKALSPAALFARRRPAPLPEPDDDDDEVVADDRDDSHDDDQDSSITTIAEPIRDLAGHDRDAGGSFRDPSGPARGPAVEVEPEGSNDELVAPIVAARNAAPSPLRTVPPAPNRLPAPAPVRTPVSRPAAGRTSASMPAPVQPPPAPSRTGSSGGTPRLPGTVSPRSGSGGTPRLPATGAARAGSGGNPRVQAEAPLTAADIDPAPGQVLFARVMYWFGCTLAVAGMYVSLAAWERDLLDWRQGVMAASQRAPDWIKQNRPEDLYFAFGGAVEGTVWAVRAWCEPTLIVLVCLAILLQERGPRRFVIPLQIGAALLMAAAVTSLLKLGIPRVRPIAFDQLWGAVDAWPASWQYPPGEAPSPDRVRYLLGSFPSAHAAAGLAVSSVLARMYPRLAILVVVIGAAGGASRFMTLSHWPTDVLAGGVIGWLAGALVTALFRPALEEDAVVPDADIAPVR